MTTRRPNYDFSAKNKTELAKRAGNQCSNPDCNAPTSSIHSVANAAHIYSAFPDGPRYNPNLTPEAYCHISNGVHLCANCHSLIDKGKGKDYPAELLQHWKSQRELNARQVVGKAQPSNNILTVKQDLKIILDRFEQQVKEISKHSDLVILLCEQIIPFFQGNKYLQKIFEDLDLQFEQLHQACVQKEEKALEEVENVYSEITFNFANNTSQGIQQALKVVEEEKSWQGGSLPSRIYDSLKNLLYVLVANGHVDFCKKYCIFHTNKREIQQFTFAPTVLESDTLIKTMSCSYRNAAIIWYRFKEAYKYWHTSDSDFLKDLENFNSHDSLIKINLRNEIINSRPENILKHTQRQKIFTSIFFRDGFQILLNHIYTTL